MITTFRQVRRSAGVYPITMLYLVSAGVVMAVADGLMTPVFGVGFLAIIAVLVSLYATWRELRALHRLVNDERARLLVRIDQLSDLLRAGGIVVPAGSAAEQTSREDDLSNRKAR